MSQRVLLVKDDASLARSIVEGLSEEGFAIKHADGRRRGPGGAAGRRMDLFILDWWLPVDFTPSLARVFPEPLLEAIR